MVMSILSYWLSIWSMPSSPSLQSSCPLVAQSIGSGSAPRGLVVCSVFPPPPPQVIPGSAAHAHGGIEVGDTLVSVEGQGVEALDLSEVRNMIVGPLGTQGEPSTHTVAVIRGKCV